MTATLFPVSLSPVGLSPAAFFPTTFFPTALPSHAPLLAPAFGSLQ